jgi:RND superfamily putative drug exporter
MSRLLASLVVRFRLAVVAAWLGAAVAASLYLPSLADVKSGPLGGLVPLDSKAVATELRSFEHFDVPLLGRVAVVQRDPDGLSPAAQARVFARAISVTRGREPAIEGILFALPVTNTAGLFPSSRERDTAAITFLFMPPERGLLAQTRLARSYAEFVPASDGLVGITGTAPARLAEADAILDALPLIAAGTIALVVLVFAFAFRSLGAPLVTLVSCGLAYVVAIRVAGWAGDALGVTAPEELDPIILALLLGIVTDYASFFLTGVRQRLAAGNNSREAAVETARRYVPIIVVAGLIVALGIATLLVGRLEFFRAFGPALALSVVVGLAVGITFVPATLAILGRAAYWPAVPQSLPVPAARRARPARLLRFATSRPAAPLAALTAIALLVAAASGLRSTQLGFTVVSGQSEDSEVRRAAEQAGTAFAPGIVSPTMLLLEAPAIGAEQAGLARLETLLDRRPGVAGVLGPRQELPGLPTPVFVAPAAARYALILEDDPLGARAIRTLERLERDLPRLLRDAGLPPADAAFAGDTALAAETIDGIRGDLARVGGAALLVNLLLLALYLRAVVAPLYLLAASVLSLAAALGITTFVFQGALDYAQLAYYVPFAVAILSLALGSDYNLFTAGRIWQEARELPLREAVLTAASRVRKAIATAGITLAGSFALLALIPLQAFRVFAFAMAVGVLIDTFFVRPVLVPALIVVFGRLGFWPAREPRCALRRADDPEYDA